jgi:hypothetical protein
MRAFALISLAACGTTHLDDDATSATADGTYTVRTRLGITVETIVPQVTTLHDFSQHPAHTLIDLADEAGVPAIEELRAVLPDALQGELEGWLDDEIRKVQIDGLPITTFVGHLSAGARRALTQFELDSTLDISGGSSTHRLTAIDFLPAGFDARYDLTAAPGDITSATASISTHGDSVAIGDHRFGFAYGDYVWRAIDDEMVTRYGTDLRGTVGNAVDCPRIASAVASECLLGACVGHESALTELCEAGLDEVVAVAHDQIAELRLDALHYASGAATIVDRDGDGLADELTAGTWDAELDLGIGLGPAPATFTAAR